MKALEGSQGAPGPGLSLIKETSLTRKEGSKEGPLPTSVQYCRVL